MGWPKPWREKASQVIETVIGPGKTRLSTTSGSWSAKGIAPESNLEVAKKSWNAKEQRWESNHYPSQGVTVRPGKAVKKRYWEMAAQYQDDDDYYNEVAPSQTELWKNGKRVRNHHHTKPFTPRQTYEHTYQPKQYEWAATRWSNFSFAGYGSAASDDDTQLYVKSPDSYLTPSSETISSKIHVYSTDKINSIKELCRLFYFKMLGEEDYLDEENAQYYDHEALAIKRERFESAMSGYVPGYTPIEQAVNFYQVILDREAYKNTKRNQHGECSQTVSFKREDFANPALNSQLNQNALSKEHRMLILNRISLIGKLGQEFHVEKDVGVKIVANSATLKSMPMTEYSQLERVEPYQRLLPAYKIKLLTKALTINIPIETSVKKQKIIILVDYSGSMNEQRKQLWVNALLVDRLRYVISGEAEVFISNFVSMPDQLRFQHLKTQSDVDKFWATFSNYPSGSCTDMSRIVEYVAAQVNSGKGLHNLKDINLSQEKPEILIINDGQDSCNSRQFPYKVNAISLLEFSEQLKDLCINTGGKQVQIDRNGDITCYSGTTSELFENVK
jgi:uncharacterized protein with von Willebrand factor type A (vWA) domain